MTTVADYLAKLAELHGLKHGDLAGKYSALKLEGVSTQDALRIIEEEVRGGMPTPDLEEDVGELSRPPKVTAVTAAGVDVDAFIKKAKAEAGEWITAAEVKEGDEFEVTGQGEVDDETFDRSYLVLPVRYSYADRKLRLGVRNVERIRRVLGPDTAQWVKQKIRVTVVETVKGLSKQRGVAVKRMILDGVQA